MSHNNVYCYAFAGNITFAGTLSGGVYMSTNSGDSWIQKIEGMTLGTTVGRLLIANNYIFAGTNAGSLVWRRPLTDLIIPLEPMPLSPLNNSTGNLINLNLVWSKPQYATGYNVVLSTDSLFSTIVVNDSLLTDSIKVVNNLLPLTNYYWKVRAKNAAGSSAFSTVSKFKTLGTPAQVTLLQPLNNSVNQSINITFK